MEDLFSVVAFLVIVGISLALKVREMMRKEAEKARQLLRQQEQARQAGTPPPLTRRPDLQQLLEVLARRAGAAEAKPAAEAEIIEIRPMPPSAPPAALKELTPPPRVAPLEPAPAAPRAVAPRHRPKRPRPSQAPLAQAAPALEVAVALPEEIAARPSERLAHVLVGRGHWQQAIVIRELLGAPRSLSPSGSTGDMGDWH